MTHVRIDDLTKIYPGSTTPALDHLSLDIGSGELIALLGPSGCGKTTAMKMIAGLLEPSAGDIRFDDRSILRDKPEHRGAVMVFQNHLLFPYMSVAENVGFGLKMRRTAPAEITRRVADMLERVKLPDMGARKPAALSGGQQQRVALARALIVEPDVLLLDEPLSNLDAHLRFDMRDLIRDLQRDMAITTILVTHDQEEAVVMADRVALILEGRLIQYDRPDAFYKRPANEATARFFGGRNFIPGMSCDGSFDSALGRLILPKDVATGPGTLTFRPENVRLGMPADGTNMLSAQIVDVVFLGSQTRLTLRVKDTLLEAIVNPNDVQALAPGDTLSIHLPQSALWVV
ncbi:ABC transporter ATP-binding protein [Gymnodinialimonas sp. 2305UL16-5]|uniref:ABC transporter ATP-binding protein n=1 Tax=Gymnodinialimonas mytili TaxID=3126503 RepID=UPI0030B56B31